MGYSHIQWNDEWIMENYLCYPSYAEMATAYNQLFGANIKPGSLKAHAVKKLSIHKPRTDYVPYTAEQIEFLKEYYPKHGCKKTALAFNKKFNANKTISGIKNFGTLYGIQVDKDVAIKNKLEPIRTKGKRKERKIGALRKECGRIVIKTQNGWEQIGRAVYKQNGYKIPKGYAVIYLDGNVNNYSIENLLAVPQKYVGLLQKYEMRSTNAEVTKTGVMWCELYDALGLKKGDLVE